MRNKERGFWREVEEWDVVMMSGIWMDQKGWDTVRRFLLKGFRWEVQLAERKNKKGRAMGGILVGVRKEIKMKEVETQKMEGLIEIVVKLKGVKLNIIEVYVRGDIDRKLEKLNEWLERREEGSRVMIGGDFNARTGKEGRILGRGILEEERMDKKSKDKRR